MSKKYLFTSECVTMGHPDKLADQISDAILDEMLRQDKHSHVACETLVTTGLALVAGEVTTEGYVDIPDVIRETVKEVGYIDPDLGFDALSCAVLTSIHEQSPDIAQGVNRKEPEEQGAGDQGMMFGFACTETDVLMPLPIYLARRITNTLAKKRFEGEIKWLRPLLSNTKAISPNVCIPSSFPVSILPTSHTPRYARP
jgi:S-adenosylmethionine synthetase